MGLHSAVTDVPAILHGRVAFSERTMDASFFHAVHSWGSGHVYLALAVGRVPLRVVGTLSVPPQSLVLRGVVPIPLTMGS